MKKIRLFIVTSLFLLIFAFGFSAVSAASPLSSFYVSISADGTGNEAFRILPDGDNIFLPSAADIKNVKICWNGGTVSYGKTGAAPLGSCDSGDRIDLSPMLAKDSQGNLCYDVTFTSASGSQRYVFYHDAKLPVVSIETSKGLSFVEAPKTTETKTHAS